MKIYRISAKPPAKSAPPVKPYRPSAEELQQNCRMGMPFTDHIDGAGYLFPDGEMPSVGDDDHRIISSMMDRLPDGYKKDQGSASYHMLAFMDITSSLRVRRTRSGLAISLIHPANRLQVKEVLKTSAREVWVDWLTKDYHTVKHQTFRLPDEQGGLAAYLQGQDYEDY